MRIPESLVSLADYGIIEEVVRPLMSGKEAQIYLVISGGEQRVAKVYKEAQNRTFQNRADYTEGRKVRNSRDQRAMGKGSRHGRAQAEAAWRSTEVDMIYRLRDAGVRVPKPHHFIDGVLVMELVTDADGDPAPRLGDLDVSAAEARIIFDRLLTEVVRMMAAGVVHGDLSDFNVLMGADGPVVIDFPQAVDASSNRNARSLLLRDVDNLHRFMARFAPDHRALPYAPELWRLYESGELTPETKLTGRHQSVERRANTGAVLDLIGDAARDERRRRERLGMSLRGAPELPRRDRPAPSLGAPAAPARPERSQSVPAARPERGQPMHPARPERGQPMHPARPERGQPMHPARPERGQPMHPARPERGQPMHPARPERGQPMHPARASSEPALVPVTPRAPAASLAPGTPPTDAPATDAPTKKRRRRRRRSKTGGPRSPDGVV